MCAKKGCPHEGAFYVGLKLYAAFKEDPEGRWPAEMWLGEGQTTLNVFSICRWHQASLTPADILSEEGKRQIEWVFARNKMAPPDWNRVQIMTKPI